MSPESIGPRERFANLVWRRKWWIVASSALAAAVTVGISSLLPVRYQAEALVVAVQPQVPERYVGSGVSATLETRLQAIEQAALSRSRLQRLVESLDLYADERRRDSEEDVLARMRRDIQIELVPGNAFKVQYRGTSPTTTASVAKALVTFIIEENLRERVVIAASTSQFLAGQIEEARIRLTDSEKRMQNARVQGAVPQALLIENQVMQDTYRALLTKAQEANLTENLEKRQIGGQLRLEDLPRVPDRPIGPSRSSVVAFGALGGLGLGVVLVAVAPGRRRSAGAAGAA